MRYDKLLFHKRYAHQVETDRPVSAPRTCRWPTRHRASVTSTPCVSLPLSRNNRRPTCCTDTHAATSASDCNFPPQFSNVHQQTSRQLAALYAIRILSIKLHKVKFSLYKPLTHKGGGGRGIAPLMLNFGDWST